MPTILAFEGQEGEGGAAESDQPNEEKASEHDYTDEFHWVPDHAKGIAE